VGVAIELVIVGLQMKFTGKETEALRKFGTKLKKKGFENLNCGGFCFDF
jgi:hypothetical protein